jgi:hypothetical protein
LKIIFSRKGFDGTAGGCPSPIVDGQPLSLPIPSKMPTPTRFGDLDGAYGALVTDLTGGRLSSASWCHLDPDIVQDTLPRRPGWRGALGQVAAAQGHLAKQVVGVGDLFIFWGLFRPVEHRQRWTFVGEREHRVWGWLQVGEVIDLGPDGSHALNDRPWLVDHPHVRAGWNAQNVLYVAADQLVIGSKELPLAGCGTLNKGYRLSHGSATPSVWRSPDWLNPLQGGCGMTYHSPERWSADGIVRCAARGQEFVANPEPSPEVHAWLTALLTENIQ